MDVPQNKSKHSYNQVSSLLNYMQMVAEYTSNGVTQNAHCSAIMAFEVLCDAGNGNEGTDGYVSCKKAANNTEGRTHE